MTWLKFAIWAHASPRISCILWLKFAILPNALFAFVTWWNIAITRACIICAYYMHCMHYMCILYAFYVHIICILCIPHLRTFAREYDTKIPVCIHVMALILLLQIATSFRLSKSQIVVRGRLYIPWSPNQTLETGPLINWLSLLPWEKASPTRGSERGQLSKEGGG